MKIDPEDHLEKIGSFLKSKRVLEVGCGDGFRSLQLAPFCDSLVAIDPDESAVRSANATHSHSNILYRVASAEDMPFEDGCFEAVVFMLSLHHIPVELMKPAIDEALRVAESDALIIFVEPGFRGSFFEMDASLGACDGDERLQKAQAYAAILSHTGLREIEEFWDVTQYRLASSQDFLDEFEMAQESFGKVDQWLTATGHRLEGERRVNVCRKHR